MLRLAQAASSEFGTKYGTPPNQLRTPGKLDGERNVVNFYGGWQYVFRPKDEQTAERIADFVLGAVENGAYIGYGQDSLKSDGGRYPRTTLFDALFQMADPDPRKVKTLCNCDCTALMGDALYFGAKIYNPDFRTMWSRTERKMIMDTGMFVELTDPLLLELGTGLMRGDILLRYNAATQEGHTACAIDSDDHHETFPVKINHCSKSRIRSGPGVEYQTLMVVSDGEIYEADGTAKDSDGFPWYRVHYDDDGQDCIGYTSSAYAAPLPQGRCTSDTWLRKSAGTKGKQIIVIPKGAEPYLTGAKKKVLLRTWYECIYGGHRGWASGLNVKEKK